jgi:hypothetical protein
MDEMKQNWQQVAEQLSGLGLKLQLHFQQAAKEGRSEETDKLKEALGTLSASIDQTVDAVANFARDDAVRQDVRDAGRSLVSALETTFGEVVGRIRNPK